MCNVPKNILVCFMYLIPVTCFRSRDSGCDLRSFADGQNKPSEVFPGPYNGIEGIGFPFGMGLFSPGDECYPTEKI